MTKILLWDIETSYYTQIGWSKWNPSMDVIKQRMIISVQYKWWGEKKVHTISIGDFPKTFKRDPWNDKHVVKKFLSVMKDADLMIAHNGDKFDMKILNARAIFNGFVTPEVRTYDTLKACKKYFAFYSNRLGDVAKFLGIAAKGKTSIDWWHNILNNSCEKSLNKLVKYGAQDIVVLEALYKKILPFIKTNHPHMALLMGKDMNVLSCSRCASTSYRKFNKYYTPTKVFQRYMCRDCGSTFRGKKPLTV